MKNEFICKFKSKINETAKGITYELYDWNEDYYLIKWNIGKNNHQEKDRKNNVDKTFNSGDYIKQ